MPCIEMFRDLSEGTRGQIIALSNEGMSQRRIEDKVSEEVVWSEPCRGLRKQDRFPQDQDLTDQVLPLSERTDTSRKPLCATGWQLLTRSRHCSITLERSQSVLKQ